MSKTKFCQGISDISDSYQAFILDQWGVLHNGDKPYDGVIECLKELKGRNKHIIILSNSGKRAAQNRETLSNLGITPGLYDDIVTSGELTWQGLNDQKEGVFENIGKKCFLMSRNNDRSIIDGLDEVEVVDNVESFDGTAPFERPLPIPMPKLTKVALPPIAAEPPMSPLTTEADPNDSTL